MSLDVRKNVGPRPGHAGRAKADSLRGLDRRAYLDRGVYVADRGSLATLTWLVFLSVLATAFTAFPLLWHFNVADAPRWAQVAAVVAVVQVAAIAWLVVMPDWMTVWCVGGLFASVAMLYAWVAAAGLLRWSAVITAMGLTEQIDRVPAWCGSVFAVSALLAFLSARIAATWQRRDDLERVR